jgi:hypothetical protein
MARAPPLKTLESRIDEQTAGPYRQARNVATLAASRGPGNGPSRPAVEVPAGPLAVDTDE